MLHHFDEICHPSEQIVVILDGHHIGVFAFDDLNILKARKHGEALGVKQQNELEYFHRYLVDHSFEGTRPTRLAQLLEMRVSQSLNLAEGLDGGSDAHRGPFKGSTLPGEFINIDSLAHVYLPSIAKSQGAGGRLSPYSSK